MKKIWHCLTLLMLGGAILQPSYAKNDDKEASPSTDTRIIGGTDAQVGDWPFIVSLTSKDMPPSEGHNCGGSLIRSDVILTAAHCVDGRAPESYDIWIGQTNLIEAETEGQKHTISKIFVHELYGSSRLQYDIALIFLETPSDQPTVSLFSNQLSPLIENDSLEVAGWGLTDINNSKVPSALQEVTLDYFSPETCQAAYGDVITPDMLCAGKLQGDKSPCYGDSGGPLVVERDNELLQVGIVSWGAQCGQRNKSGVFARVSYFSGWIDKHLNGQPPQTFNKIDFESGSISDAPITLEGAADWQVVNAGSDSAFSLQAPSDLGHNEYAAFGLKVSSGDNQILSFDYSVSSEEGFDFLELYVNSQRKGAWSGNNDWNKYAVQLPEGTHDLLWVYRKDVVLSDGQDSAWVDNIAIGEMLDSHYYTMDFENGFFLPGNKVSIVESSWEVSEQFQTEQTGQFSLASAPGLDDDESSKLEIIANTTEGFLTFDYLTSTEYGYDFLELYIDDQLFGSWSGDEEVWNTFTTFLEEGQHKLTWIYKKDYIVSSGVDRAFIDNIRIPVSSIATPYTELDQTADGQADIVWWNKNTQALWLYAMSGSTIMAYDGLPFNSNYRPLVRGDFNGDGNSDLLWREGDNVGMSMYFGKHELSNQVIETIGAEWMLISVGDYNGDGSDDLLWRNNLTGILWQYLLQGSNIISSKKIATLSDPNWRIIASRDLDADGKDDILFRHSETGSVWKYMMDGSAITQSKQVIIAGGEWMLAAVGDFDGNQQADLLWRNVVTGKNYVYLLDNGEVNWNQRGEISQFSDQNWNVVMVADFNGDGNDDILWRHQGDGRNYTYQMDGMHFSGSMVNTIADLNWKVVPQ
jgi:secreted trypsin-like serine protease